MADTEVQVRQVIVQSGLAPRYQDLSQHHRGKDIMSGHSRQALSIAEPGIGVNYRASYAKMPPYPGSIRHRHNFEQIHFIHAGEWESEGKQYGPGWLGYVGEGVYYGPHRVTKDINLLLIQFSGPSQAKFHSREQERKAQETLVSEGVVFKSDIAHWPDGREQDGFEAMAERAIGERIRYPEARQAEEMWFQTENFPWVPTSLPGISARKIACFNDSGPAVTFFRMDKGAKIPAGKAASLMVDFIYEGEVTYAGQRCPAISSLTYPAGASFGAVESTGRALILRVELQSDGEPPKFNAS